MHDSQLRSKNVVVFGMNEESSEDQLNQFRTILGERLGMKSQQVSISDALTLVREKAGWQKTIHC